MHIRSSKTRRRRHSAIPNAEQTGHLLYARRSVFLEGFTTLRKRHTKVRAAPLVFLSPPSSKLCVNRNQLSIPHRARGNVLLASLQCDLVFVLARSAFQSQYNLLRRLRLLSQSTKVIRQWGNEGDRRRGGGPSCGRWVWSDHRNQTACGHSVASLGRKASPCPFCTGSLCVG